MASHDLFAALRQMKDDDAESVSSQSFRSSIADTCGNCGEINPTIPCENCRSTYYCSQACRQNDAVRHRRACFTAKFQGEEDWDDDTDSSDILDSEEDSDSSSDDFEDDLPLRGKLALKANTKSSKGKSRLPDSGSSKSIKSTRQKKGGDEKKGSVVLSVDGEKQLKLLQNRLAQLEKTLQLQLQQQPPVQPIPSREYVIQWTVGELGISFSRSHNKNVPCVKSVNEKASASVKSSVSAGDELRLINGTRTRDLGFDGSMRFLSDTPKPVALDFSRPSPASAESSRTVISAATNFPSDVKMYTVLWQDGPLGIVLTKTADGRPMIKRLTGKGFSSGLEHASQGDILTLVNNKVCSQIGYKAVCEILTSDQRPVVMQFSQLSSPAARPSGRQQSSKELSALQTTKTLPHSAREKSQFEKLGSTVQTTTPPNPSPSSVMASPGDGVVVGNIAPSGSEFFSPIGVSQVPTSDGVSSRTPAFDSKDELSPISRIVAASTTAEQAHESHKDGREEKPDQYMQDYRLKHKEGETSLAQGQNDDRSGNNSTFPLPDSAASAYHHSNEYTIQWIDGSLGIAFQKDDAQMTASVKRLTGKGSNEVNTTVREGDVLLSFNGIRATGIDYNEMMKTLGSLAKPITLLFRRQSSLSRQSQNMPRNHSAENSFRSLNPTHSMPPSQRESDAIEDSFGTGRSSAYSSSHAFGETSQNFIFNSSQISSMNRYSEPPVGSSRQSQHTYVFLWTGGPLGITMKKDPRTSLPIVRRLTGRGNCEDLAKVESGDLLLSINNESVVNMPFDDIIGLLGSSEKPVELTFRHPKLKASTSVDRRSALSAAKSSESENHRVMRNTEPFARITEPNLAESQIAPSHQRTNSLQEGQYETNWTNGPLGVSLYEDDVSHLPVVSRVTGKGVYPDLALVTPGDMLLKVNGASTWEVGFEESLRLLKTSPKPVMLRWQRKLFVDATEAEI